MQRLHGQVVKLSPISKSYMVPLALKSDFVLSFCELVVGGKNGLEVRLLTGLCRGPICQLLSENMLILSDFHQALLDQHIPEADRVAPQALGLYVNDSRNAFNHCSIVTLRTALWSLITRSWAYN